MNTRTEALLKIVAIAYAMVQQDMEDARSDDVAMDDVCLVEQAIRNALDEVDPDVAHLPLYSATLACRDLRLAIRRDQDFDGVAYQTFCEALDPIRDR